MYQINLKTEQNNFNVKYILKHSNLPKITNNFWGNFYRFIQLFIINTIQRNAE